MAIDVERLKDAERKFGGMFHAPRVKHSPLDPKPSRRDRGCDRMVYQDYAPLYAQVLPERLNRIVEMGIFRGTGLAMWSILYPDADIIGLDVDLNRVEENMQLMLMQGAFKGGLPTLYEFDELNADNWNALGQVILPGTVDVWVDDALHRTDVIMQAWRKAKKFMKRGGVYIIEDNDEIPAIMTDRYAKSDEIEVVTEGRLTALCLNV